jgi:hypothetical protein
MLRLQKGTYAVRLYMNKLTQMKVMPTLDDLAVDPSLAKSLSSEDAEYMLARLAAVHIPLLVQALSSKGSKTEDTEDRLLNIESAAERLCVKTDWLYRNWRQFVFARKIKRQIRFSSHGVDKYIKQIFK